MAPAASPACGLAGFTPPAVSRAFVIDLERGRRPRAELTRVLAVIRALDAAITLTGHQTKSAEEALDELLGRS